MSSKEVWLWILLVMQPYNSRTNEILELCGGNAELAAKMIRDEPTSLVTEREKRSAHTIRTSEVHKLMALCEKNDIRIITLDDKDYPKRLRTIFAPPIVLFVKGSLEGLDDEIALSVVGARNCDKYSADITKSICGSLAKLGTVIVSGCAVGVDAAAHLGAVEAGGKTVAVLGCGLLVNYPAENAQLKTKILETGGALISELLPNTRTFAAYFQHRNRIISGLSTGTLVTEASNHSGSLITAEYAIEQGRDLFCVPPRDITSAKYAGVIPFLRDGAIPIFGYIDIVNEYIFGYLHNKYSENLIKRLENNGVYSLDDEKALSKTSANPKADGQASKTESAEKAEESDLPRINAVIKEDVLSSLEPNARVLLALIAKMPQNLDLLVESTGIPMLDICSSVTDLEIMGYVKRLMDGNYCVTNEICAE